MFEPESLAEEYTKHVRDCPSSFIACSGRGAVEAWFKVELAYLLHKAGCDSVSLDYDYPNSRKKADLAVKGSWGLTVFELKCFAKGADSRKMDDWPNQLERLFQLVESGVVAQGAAIATYTGYSENRVQNLIARHYPSPWAYAGPLVFLEGTTLQLVVATCSRAFHECAR